MRNVSTFTGDQPGLAFGGSLSFSPRSPGALGHLPHLVDTLRTDEGNATQLQRSRLEPISDDMPSRRVPRPTSSALGLLGLPLTKAPETAGHAERNCEWRPIRHENRPPPALVSGWLGPEETEREK